VVEEEAKRKKLNESLEKEIALLQQAMTEESEKEKALYEETQVRGHMMGKASRAQFSMGW